ncbi:MAG: hypothetical protein AAF573_11495 [Bacteroidota bacterium]
MVKKYETKNRSNLSRKSSNLLFYCSKKWVWIYTFLLSAVVAFGQDSFDETSQNVPPPSSSVSDDTTTTVPPSLSEFDVQTLAGINYDTSYIGQKLRKRGIKNLTLFGYARMFAYGRNMVEAYPNLSPFERAYGIGDGYREPMLSLTMFGRPNGKTTFGTEMFVFTPYLDGGTKDNVFTINLGINFYGNFRTQHGNFGVRAGGIHWYNLSGFTMGIFQVLDRFSIFDRTPWEAVNNDEKYESYYRTGAPNPGDLRWNNQAFQGLIINGGNLPGNFNFDLFWGKTQPNGGLANGLMDPFASINPTLDAGSVPTYIGIAGDSRFVSNFITGGKIGRSFGSQKQTFHYNVIYSQTALDSLINADDRRYQVHSLTYDLNIAKLKLKGELAMGSYESPNYEKRWGEALMLHAYFPKAYTYLPIDVQLYQINKNFFNQNGEIATNSNPDIVNDFGLTAGATGVGGQLALVGQLVHNRRGININTNFEVEGLKFSVGWGLAQEIDAASSQITYVHRINGLALSRIYNPFPAGATSPTIFGPYSRKISFFRGVSGVVQTTDLDPATAQPINRKYFSSVDIQAKYKTSINDHALYVFYLGSFASADATAPVVPLYDDDTYLYVQYHELDVYYELFPKFLLTGYLGVENARGGQFTAWDLESNLPLDQVGTGIGIGFDWTIAKNTGLYIRQRWMNFEDRNFALDTFKGREVTIELKTFF